MHLDIASKAARSLPADDPPPGGPFGRSLLHVDSAVLNEGEDGSIPGTWRLMRAVRPFVVGSGKLGTPCERMQSANLMPCAARFEALLGALGRELDEPHAVSASRQAQAATMLGTQPGVDLERCSWTPA
jgi:hypothetical protein